jgi:hypothetical protein
MVKIRYAELPAGLHVATAVSGRCTIVYLLPGLTAAQRREALTVARRSARMGHGPNLPVLDMALAVAADRTRTTARASATVLRKHPILMLPLLLLVSGVIIATMLTVMTSTVAPGATVPQSGQQPGTGGGGASTTAASNPDPAHGSQPDNRPSSGRTLAPSMTPTPKPAPALQTPTGRSASAERRARRSMPVPTTPAFQAVGRLCMQLNRLHICPDR